MRRRAEQGAPQSHKLYVLVQVQALPLVLIKSSHHIDGTFQRKTLKKCNENHAKVYPLQIVFMV